jgi:hypothetical protein
MTDKTTDALRLPSSETSATRMTKINPVLATPRPAYECDQRQAGDTQQQLDGKDR